MLKIKSAQIPDFTDVNVRRIFGYADDILRTRKLHHTDRSSFLQDEETLRQLHEIEQDLQMSNPDISLDDLKNVFAGELRQTSVADFLNEILGPGHWTEEPNRGIQ